MANVEERAARREAWQSLRSNPDYRTEWKAHGSAAPVLEPAPFPLRVQSEADLMARRWGLLAWEDPRVLNRAMPFRSDVPMVKAMAVEPEGRECPALRDLVRESAAAFTGLRLRDGTVVLKAERRRRVEQIRVTNSDVFDPAASGLLTLVGVDAMPPSKYWGRLENFAWIIGARRRGIEASRSSGS